MSTTCEATLAAIQLFLEEIPQSFICRDALREVGSVAGVFVLHRSDIHDHRIEIESEVLEGFTAEQIIRQLRGQMLLTILQRRAKLEISIKRILGRVALQVRPLCCPEDDKTAPTLPGFE